ncbi:MULTISPECIES: LysR family transcriptional regulator [unclassified Sphingopyxis]|uniref:LysR family transcriptional regulator n=1 Tax=unclassified Sphingopyxis TaxID=2614943 RepID=UPI002854A409|nr:MULTISPECIES: LysR family transcriptional regulator [unclassified Sphingopyxis]MDR6833146.1 DNA-binding transcriptional LysR family regulator [Sphingopyxis sp. BE122]MDR7228889.1 DNA-binding transcriptional LysR family regulator [Sphingopyxis sp. BE259]
MDRLLTLEMFVAVASEGGFAAAARKLNSSPPAVTRGIAALEARLGTLLFHRSTRAVALTDEGAAFLDQARRILADLAGAERELRGATAAPRGQLYVTAPVMFGRLHVLPVVGALMAQHDELVVRMMLIDRNVRIVEEGIDVAVRIGALADSGLTAVRIGRVRQMLVASPAYLARRGAPQGVDDLAGHDLIGTMGPRATSDWQLASGRWRLDPRPRLVVNTVDAALAAAEAGLGIANLLSYQLADALAAGRLIALLADDQPPALPVHLLFEQSRAGLPAARAFVEAMKARARVAGLG